MNYRLKDFSNSPIFALSRKKLYYQYYDFVQTVFEWAEDEIRAWQWDNIKLIVDYAYQHVPYYRNLYKSIGFEPGDMRTFSDFEKLPTVSKRDIKAHLTEFYSDELKHLACRNVSTGGSSGHSLDFKVDEELFYREDAMYRSYWERTGFSIGERCVILRGQRIISNDRFKVRYNSSRRYMYLDSAYIGDRFFNNYHKALVRFNAPNIQAYPSVLSLLARTYKRNQVKAPKFKRIYLGSENVYEDQLEIINEVFRPNEVLNQYGHSERVLLALQKPGTDGLGFVPFYGYMELLDTDHHVISDSNITGEIVGTGISRVMPFIRYRTNDFASFYGQSYSGFMQGWKRVNRIEGRLQEYIVSKDLRLVPVTYICGSHINQLTQFLDVQYEQPKVGEVVLNATLAPNEQVTDIEMDIIINKIKQVFDGQIECKVNFVDHIERTGRNKKLALIQHLDIESLSK